MLNKIIIGTKGKCMKYFELQDNPDLKYAPKIKNGHGIIATRDITLEKYPELPKYQLFILNPATKIIFTDFILYPFLLVSPSVMDVIQMYKELCFYREVILLDQIGGESKLYYLPVFKETNKLIVIEKENKVLEDSDFARLNEKVYLDNNIFWVRDSQKRHTIISLDLMESLLRRNITGIGIKEVELFVKRRTD